MLFSHHLYQACIQDDVFVSPVKAWLMSRNWSVLKLLFSHSSLLTNGNHFIQGQESWRLRMMVVVEMNLLPLRRKEGYMLLLIPLHYWGLQVIHILLQVSKQLQSCCSFLQWLYSLQTNTILIGYSFECCSCIKNMNKYLLIVVACSPHILAWAD